MQDWHLFKREVIKAISGGDSGQETGRGLMQDDSFKYSTHDVLWQVVYLYQQYNIHPKQKAEKGWISSQHTYYSTSLCSWFHLTLGTNITGCTANWASTGFRNITSLIHHSQISLGKHFLSNGSRFTILHHDFCIM